MTPRAWGYEHVAVMFRHWLTPLERRALVRSGRWADAVLVAYSRRAAVVKAVRPRTAPHRSVTEGRRH